MTQKRAFIPTDFFASSTGAEVCSAAAATKGVKIAVKASMLK